MPTRTLLYVSFTANPQNTKVRRALFRIDFRFSDKRLCSGFLLRHLKADSHIAFRAYAAPMPFPCHAVR